MIARNNPDIENQQEEAEDDPMNTQGLGSSLE